MSKTGWKKTPFTNIDDAFKAAQAMDLRPIWQETSSEQGLKCFKCWSEGRPSLVAQKLEGGPVLQKQLPQKRRRSRGRSAAKKRPPLPSPSERFAGYDRYFARDWRWVTTIKDEYTDRPITEGTYRVYPGPFPDTLVEVLEVRGELYQRVLSPPEEVRRDAEAARKVVKDWIQQMRSKGFKA